MRDWLGGAGRIVLLRCQFRAVNTRGMTVCARGTVTAVRVEDGVRLVDLDVWTEDQDGNQIAPGKAVVELD